MTIITDRPARSRTLLAFVLALGGFASLLVGCGDDDDNSGADVSIDDAWGRPTAPGAEVTAFYFEVTNNAEASDRVVGVSADGCTRTELHQMTMQDDVMQMSEAGASELTVGAGEVLVFEPNGLHVMCLGLVEPLEQGDKLLLKLELETAGVLTSTVVIEDR